MPRTRSEYEAATDSIKRILKQQGLTYKNLAIRLGLSESGVKKILTAQDGSFQRLAQISRELGITMGELLTGEEEAMFELSYSREQQAYLVKEPRALRLYWALVYERRDLKEALSFLHLLPKDAFPILRRLDELRLIELLPEGRLRIPPVRQIRWVGEGPLLEKLYREWALSILNGVARPGLREGELFMIRYFRASKKTVEDLISALKDLEIEFTRRAIQEMRTNSPDLVHLRWLGAVDQKSFLG